MTIPSIVSHGPGTLVGDRSCVLQEQIRRRKPDGNTRQNTNVFRANRDAKAPPDSEHVLDSEEIGRVFQGVS
jgi:hypothetical protein